MYQFLQLDLSSETVSEKSIFPRDQEGYGGSETTNEKLSSSRIHWFSDPSSVLFFGKFLEKLDKKWPNKLESLQRWMRLAKSSDTEVSGTS